MRHLMPRLAGAGEGPLLFHLRKTLQEAETAQSWGIGTACNTSRWDTMEQPTPTFRTLWTMDGRLATAAREASSR